MQSRRWGTIPDHDCNADYTRTFAAGVHDITVNAVLCDVHASDIVGQPTACGLHCKHAQAEHTPQPYLGANPRRPIAPPVPRIRAPIGTARAEGRAAAWRPGPISASSGASGSRGLGHSQTWRSNRGRDAHLGGGRSALGERLLRDGRRHRSSPRRSGRDMAIARATRWRARSFCMSGR